MESSPSNYPEAFVCDQAGGSLEDESIDLDPPQEARASGSKPLGSAHVGDRGGAETTAVLRVDALPDRLADRILVAVSDHREQERMLKQLIGYEVLMAEDGPSLLASGDLSKVDAVVVDEAFPPWGGAEFCRRLRRDEKLAAVMVTMMVSREDGAGMEEALEAGAHEVLAKPYHPAELAARIRSMVQCYRHCAEVQRKNRVLGEALSDLCESEALLVQAEKLSVLGEMSAGIVHEINNPLNYAKTALYVLRRMVNAQQGSEKVEMLDVINDIDEGMERVGNIVGDLRSFASRGSSEKIGMSLRTVLRTARRILGERLALLRYVEEVPEDLRIQGNENKLCQVMLNFLKNGVEAIEMAGRSPQEAEIRVWARDLGSEVELCIRDNGCGMDSVDQRRILEPFFSRKENGKGMGLGLSICARILEEHRATLAVESELGGFTQFTIRFPSEQEYALGGRASED